MSSTPLSFSQEELGKLLGEGRGPATPGRRRPPQGIMRVTGCLGAPHPLPCTNHTPGAPCSPASVQKCHPAAWPPLPPCPPPMTMTVT